MWSMGPPACRRNRNATAAATAGTIVGRKNAVR
jgi:hypothetical protein